MARRKIDSEARTFRIRKDTIAKLNAYSEKTCIPMTAIVNMGLEMYLESKEPSKK